ncbi:MAG: tRNA (adenosine(37)-N6)-threonylcarbamoyltransferase complex dimerization subunit type 1 TsaB [Chloroflexi bacterium]|nr:tRNA (adenosine(37)-N6)-threonylcarbamoyltransferase complex dimerization subunit type 1 TsaB [Chloroflexota bacterium]
MLLAIDTATRAASIALYRAGVLGELTWRSRDNHTVETMEQIVRLLALVGATQRELQAIGVALGPGSFTGLRVGMSIAKGLAFGRQIPLLGIPTLDGIAHAHAHQTLPIWTILEAGRGRMMVARYAVARGAAKRASEYALTNAAGIADLVGATQGERNTRALVCGDVDTALADLLTERFGTRVVIASPAQNARRAGALAELAWARFQRGKADDASSLAPIYLAQGI